jgi:hypothetical protein
MASPYKVEVKLKHPKATVSQVHLEAGHETPIHAHEHDYVVHPRAATKVLKTTYKDGRKHSEEEIEHKPGEPYFVAASEDGVTFSLKNIGDGPMLCDKTFIRPK